MSAGGRGRPSRRDYKEAGGYCAYLPIAIAIWAQTAAALERTSCGAMRQVAAPLRDGASRVKKLDLKSKLKHATPKEMSQLILDLAKEHPGSESLAHVCNLHGYP